MPLITCPDCQQKISDSAPACIHCGRVNRRTNRKIQEKVTTQQTDTNLKVWKSVFVGLMLISLAMAYFGWGNFANYMFIGSLLGWAWIKHLIYYRNQ